MVSYQDILYPIDLSYGIREIYDLAPWAFDLFIFAAVLSAIFKPVMEKLPIFSGKKGESDRLAYIFSFIFAGSTVYWMQVQGTNLAAAAPYLILILFAILGIFIYNLIASTTWGAKHKFFSGVIAFFITIGLCQSLFGVSDIFRDVFPIFGSLFVFFSRILLWIILFTILFILAGRFWEGKDGGTHSGGGPSGDGPSSEPSSPGGVSRFFEKAKDWIPYKLRNKEGRKEIDLNKYEKQLGEAEVQIDKAYSEAKELDKLLTIQQNLVKQLPSFFANLINNLKTIKEYFQKNNTRGGKPSADVITWNNRVGEIVNALTSTNVTVEKEFAKLIKNQVEIRDNIDSFYYVLGYIQSAPNILMHRTESDEKFFKEHDKSHLSNVAEIQSKIAELRTKNDALTVLFAKIKSVSESMNKHLPANIGEDLVKNMKNLLIGDLNDIHGGLNNIITHQGHDKLFEEIDELIKSLGKNTFDHVIKVSELLTEARTRTSNFAKDLEQINSLLEEYKKDIEAADKFRKETYFLSDALFKISQEIEEKENKRIEDKKKAELFLRTVPTNNVFHSMNGRSFNSLKELADAANILPDDIFNHHVSKSKNDFADWIETTIGDKALANLLRKIFSKKEFSNKLRKRVAEYLKAQRSA